MTSRDTAWDAFRTRSRPRTLENRKKDEKSRLKNVFEKRHGKVAIPDPPEPRNLCFRLDETSVFTNAAYPLKVTKMPPKRTPKRPRTAKAAAPPRHGTCTLCYWVHVCGSLAHSSFAYIQFSCNDFIPVKPLQKKQTIKSNTRIQSYSLVFSLELVKYKIRST